jgi:hypothetical protein
MEAREVAKDKGEDLTSRYNGYSVYLPSLQQGYAAFPFRARKSVRNGNLPKGLRLEDLDFLNSSSRLWHCGYTLYSAGQFTKAQITTPDMVSNRSSGTVVVGDSGGYQVGTGKLPAVSRWAEDAKQPDVIYRRWLNQRSIRDTILRWLDRYSDFAMTLDMPLWVTTEKKSSSSPFANLTTQQLIELSVENLRYFADKRGRATGSKAKFLNVLQDVGNGTGDAWYQAVKDFDFEGWALGGDTKSTFTNILRWTRRLLEDKKLERAEWIHVLMASPPVASVYLTAMQRALNTATGHEVCVSYDSSTPFQTSGIRQQIAQLPEFADTMASWRFKQSQYPQSPEYLSQEQLHFLDDNDSPITRLVSINDFHAKEGGFEQTFLDPLAQHMLTNHNLYIYHRAAVDANDIAFKEGASTGNRMPAQLSSGIGAISECFQVENFESWLLKHEAELNLQLA